MRSSFSPLCCIAFRTNASPPLFSRSALYSTSTSSGYFAVVLPIPLLCKIQPVTAQSSSSRHWRFNVLLRRTSFVSVTLAFLGPLPTKISPEDTTNLRGHLPLLQHTNSTRRDLTPFRSCRPAAPKERKGPEREPGQGLDEWKGKRLDMLKKPKANNCPRMVLVTAP